MAVFHHHAVVNRSLPHKAGFTLVELMVVLVIVALLSALSLSGLAGVRQRAKADKTRSTIRKLHEIIVPQYEDYGTRRVKAGGGTLKWFEGQYIADAAVIIPSTVAASNRLWALRVLMALEMPDQWSDIAPSSTVPAWAVTAPARRYASFPTPAKPINEAYESAECLAMIVMRSGFAADLVDSFRADEIGDVDEDGRPEVLDGWGKPIGFIRWPVGFDSPLLQQDANTNPDPFDPMRRSALFAYPGSTSQTDYGVMPLIFSCGPDGAIDEPIKEGVGKTPNYGGYAGASDATGSSLAMLGLSNASMTVSVVIPSNRAVLPGKSDRPGAAVDSSARDNITNYDLKK